MTTDQLGSHSIAAIREQLLAKFPTMTASSFMMNIRILRSTSSTNSQYIIRASHFDDTYLAIERADKVSVISIRTEESDVFVKMLTEKFNTLWTTKTLFKVTNSTSYEMDDTIIRIGELRNHTSPETIRGTFCLVSQGGAEGGRNRAILDDVVGILGFAESKKYFRSWPADNSHGEMELWCDALKNRV
jgi:hypothetical protein